MFNNITNYIYDKKVKLTVYENNIYINNYKLLKDFSDKEIILELEKTLLKVTGKNLVIKKMIDNEILISGEIKNINMGD